MPSWVEIIFDLMTWPAQAIHYLSLFIYDNLIQAVLNWGINLITSTVPVVISALLPQSIVDMINATDLTTIINMVFDVLWFYPMVPLLALYGAAYAIIGLVRLIRLVIYVTPFIG